MIPNNFKDLIIKLVNQLSNFKFKDNMEVILNKEFDDKYNVVILDKNMYWKDEKLFKVIDYISPDMQTFLKILKIYEKLYFDNISEIEILEPQNTIIKIDDDKNEFELFSKKIKIDDAVYNDIQMKFNYDDYTDSTDFNGYYIYGARNIESNTFIENTIPAVYITAPFDTKFQITNHPGYSTKQVLKFDLFIVDYLDNLDIDDYISSINKIRIPEFNIIINNIEITNKYKLDIGTLNSSIIKLIKFNMSITRHKNYSHYNDLIYC